MTKEESYSSIFAKRALSGAAAGCVESTITSPFETIKTRLQIEHGTNRSPWYAGKLIFAEKGLPGFYYGLSACLLQNMGKVAIRFSGYGYYTKLFESIYFNKTENKNGPLHRLCSGGCAGATEALWIAPCERLKTLRVTQLNLPKGQQQYTSLMNSVRVLLTQQGGGIPDLFVGLVPTACRNAVAVGFRFLFYSTLKDLLLNMNMNGNKQGRVQWWHAPVCGFTVGVGTTLLSQPADVVKSRVQGIV